jgi:Helix-turn-helix domain
MPTPPEEISLSTQSGEPRKTRQKKKVYPQESGLTARWPAEMVVRFCPVSSVFLEHYANLKPVEGEQPLNSSEAMTIVHLLDYKWSSRDPFPTVGTLAKRLGLTIRAVRNILKRLEKIGYLERIPAPHGGPNRYNFDGLYKAFKPLVPPNDLQILQEKKSASEHEKHGETLNPFTSPDPLSTLKEAIGSLDTKELATLQSLIGAAKT